MTEDLVFAQDDGETRAQYGRPGRLDPAERQGREGKQEEKFSNALAGGAGKEAPMEEFMREALRLWLRGAGIPSVVELLEAIKAELLTRNVHLEYTIEYRIPPEGPGNEEAPAGS